MIGRSNIFMITYLYDIMSRTGRSRDPQQQVIVDASLPRPAFFFDGFPFVV